MSLGTELQTEIVNTINAYGGIVRVRKHFVGIADDGYDDNTVLSTGSNGFDIGIFGTAEFDNSSGGNIDVWTSGLKQPLNSFKSQEAQLLEQGKIKKDDSVIYFDNTIDLSGGLVEIGLGSPVTESYSITDGGVNKFDLNGSVVYQKAFVRFLPLGSLSGI